MVRAGKLEHMLFWMPVNALRKDDASYIARRMDAILGQAPRDESTSVKLKYFLEGVYELACDVESVNNIRKVRGERLPAFNAWTSRVKPTLVRSCSIIFVLHSVDQRVDQRLIGLACLPGSFYHS